MKTQAIKTTFLGCLMFLLCGFNQAEWNLTDEDWHLNTDITKEMTKKQVVTQRARDVVSEDVHYICSGVIQLIEMLDNPKITVGAGASINSADIDILISQIPRNYPDGWDGFFAYFDNEKRLIHLDLVERDIRFKRNKDNRTSKYFRVAGLDDLFNCQTKANAAFRIEEDEGMYAVSMETIFNPAKRIEYGDQEFLIFLRHKLFTGFKGEDWLKDYKTHSNRYDVTPILLSYATEGRTLSDLLNAIQVSMPKRQKKAKKYGGDEAQNSNDKDAYLNTFRVYLYPHDDTRNDYVLFNLIIDIERNDEPEKTVIKAILSLVYI